MDEEYESIRSSIEEEKIDAGGEIIQKPANIGFLGHSDIRFSFLF